MPIYLGRGQGAAEVAINRETCRACGLCVSDLTNAMAKWRPIMGPLALAVMRPFMGRHDFNAMKQFIGPTLDVYLGAGREDWFFYNAPLALYFYAPTFADAGDPMIAATYAMLAGKALGLGTCFLGFPGYIVHHSKDVKRKYGLPSRAQQGLAVIFGHPAVKYRKALVRRLAEVVG